MRRKGFARELDWVCYGTLRWVDVRRYSTGEISRLHSKFPEETVKPLVTTSLLLLFSANVLARDSSKPKSRRSSTGLTMGQRSS